MNDKETQQAFVQYLLQKSGAKSEKELQRYISSLGEDGLKKEYEEFTKLLNKQQVQVAKKGAMINYLSSLRQSGCPKGTVVEFHKEGGKVCKKCTPVTSNAIELFKCGSKMKPKKKSMK